MKEEVKYIDQGGNAFPLGASEYGGYGPDPGMTLRDWFAGQADVPWNAVLDTLSLRGEKTPTVERMAEYRAQLKYIEADAMIVARKGV